MPCGTVAHMSRTIIIRTSWLVIAAFGSLPGHPQQVVAHVLDAKGDWHLEGSASSVSAGEGLTAGANITAGSNRPGDAITIVHDDDMSRQRIACDTSQSNPCRNPITVAEASATPAPQSQFKGMVQTALAILLNKPPAIGSHYALTLARGDATQQEWEGVVSLDPAQGIILLPPPRAMPAGRYTASIARAGEAESATDHPTVLTSEGKWKPLPLAAPGLYEVSLMGADGEQVANVMFLAVPVAEYAAKQQEFDEMARRTDAWTGPSARADGHLFLRAFLLSRCQTC
jgi:hypothetical protein